jgi:hypothetical protein
MFPGQVEDVAVEEHAGEQGEHDRLVLGWVLGGLPVAAVGLGVDELAGGELAGHRPPAPRELLGLGHPPGLCLAGGLVGSGGDLEARWLDEQEHDHVDREERSVTQGVDRVRWSSRRGTATAQPTRPWRRRMEALALGLGVEALVGDDHGAAGEVVERPTAAPKRIPAMESASRNGQRSGT